MNGQFKRGKPSRVDKGKKMGKINLIGYKVPNNFT